MKIENQPLLVANKPGNASWASDQQWLLHADAAGSKPNLLDTRQADEYYWQHQHQLQQSDITFNSVVRDTNPLIPPDATLLKSPINLMEKFNLHQLNNINAHPITVPTENVDRVRKGACDVLTAAPILVGTSQAPLPLLPTISIETMSEAINTVLRKTLPTPTATIMLKPYQLFVDDDDRIELTLNTTHLSKQQGLELQTFIRQWLNQKGFTLKQLVLNGEQQ
jgi:hypothetical protein